MKTCLRSPSVRPSVIGLSLLERSSSIIAGPGGRGLHSCLAYDGRQRVIAPGVGLLETERDLIVAVFGHPFAVAESIEIDRLEEGQDRLGLAQAHHLPQMRQQV